MAEENTPNTENQTPETKTENMIPKSRFDEVYGQMKAAKDSLEAVQAEIEALKGFKTQFESLNTEYAALKVESEGHKNSFEGVVNAKIETIPEALRGLVPTGTAQERMEWISKAETAGLFNQPKVEIGKQTNTTKPEVKLDLTKTDITSFLSNAFSNSK